jgi:NAD(P)H-dependent flavin oxidoreductase YrpB (nitropropane dioxygenase family)
MTEDLNMEALPGIAGAPEHVTPATVYLASEACRDTGVVIHAGNGFFGRVQVAFNRGAVLSDKPNSVEDFAARYAEIAEDGGWRVPSPEQSYLHFVAARVKAERG